MGQGLSKRCTVLIVEDDLDLRRLTTTLLEDEQLETIECESAEAALAIMLMRGRDIAMIFADVRLPGAMDGIDLAWEVRLRATARWAANYAKMTDGNLDAMVAYLCTVPPQE